MNPSEHVLIRTGHDAEELLMAYRAEHRIEAVNARDPDYGSVHVCEHCRIRVHRVLGGWRHDVDEIRALRLSPVR